jgi:undecaprenyl pyrophosphate phosphatase UppP
VFAAATAVVTVHFLTRYFKKSNLTPFGIYCLLFGAAMVVFTLTVGAP